VSTVPEKPQLLNWLLRQDLVGVHSCRSLLDRAARACFKMDAVAAAQYTEATFVAFWNYVLRTLEDHSRRGLSPSFSIQSSETRTFCCYPVPYEAHGLVRRNAVRVQDRPTFLRMIDDVTDRQYEAMSCVLLEALGATKVELTRAQGDGGIDAFGLIERSYGSHLFGGTHHPIRFVVQSKKYKDAIDAGRMKEFIQTLSEVKYGGQSKTENVIPGWFKAARGPIIGFVVSHRGFQSGADSRARSHGILTADSVDLAEVIALKGSLYGSDGIDKAKACLDRISQHLAADAK